MLDVDCDIVGGDWPAETDWAALAREAVAHALDAAGHRGALEHAGVLLEVAVRLTDDSEMQRLNREWRGRDQPTNVLSFPMYPKGGLPRRLDLDETDLLLGDIALGWETVAREAAEKEIPAQAHAVHLIVHGTLHLVGHDHAEDSEADAMEALERRILKGLGIADPYAPASGRDVAP